MIRLSLMLLALLPMLGCTAQRVMPIRPIAVQVVDRDSRQPVEGVQVFYSLHTVATRRSFLLPNIEPDIGPKISYKLQKWTDKSGEVRFHVKDFLLRSSDRFSFESIVINIEVDMTKKLAQISKESLEYYYSKEGVRREGPVDNVDLVERFLVRDQKTRDEVLFRPNIKYSGSVLRNQASSPYDKGEIDSWFSFDEPYKMIYGGDSLARETDFVLIPLAAIQRR